MRESKSGGKQSKTGTYLRGPEAWMITEFIYDPTSFCNLVPRVSPLHAPGSERRDPGWGWSRVS